MTVTAGSDVYISPLISPGALLQQYFIDWLDRATSQTLVRIQGRRNQNLSFRPNERYSIDPETFMFTIHSVRYEDQGNYTGVVGVMDPEGMPFIYPQTETRHISLEVNGESAFMHTHIKYNIHAHI